MENRALQNAERTAAANFPDANETLTTASVAAVSMDGSIGAMGTDAPLRENLRTDGGQRFDDRVAETRLQSSDQFNALLDRGIDLEGS